MMDAFMPTHDGHVGNLETKSLRELKDLLARQEKLLKMRSTVDTLPDKGEKNKKLIESLKEVIHRKTESDPVFEDEQRLQSDAPLIEPKEDTFTKGAKVEDSKTVHSSKSETTSKPVSKFKSERLQARTIERTSLEGAQNVVLQDSPSNRNTADEPMDFAELHSAFDSMSLKGRDGDVAASKTDKSHSSKEHTESAASPPVYKFSKAKEISIQESLDLQQAQKLKQEALQAEQSAERLARRLHIKMESFNPEGVDMSYRSRVEDQDHVSDSDDEPEVDYEG